MLKPVLAGLLCWTAALLPGAALADGVGSIILLGVVRNGHLDPSLSARLSEHLEHVGEPVVKGAHLSSGERLCIDQECMEQVAQREGAEHVMTIQIATDKQAPPFIRLALLDTHSRRPISKEGSCDPCSGDALGITLESLADRALLDLRQPPPVVGLNPIDPGPPLRPDLLAVRTESSPLSAPIVGKTPSLWQRLDALPRGRKIGAGILGGVSVATLVSSIALAATNGHYTGLACSTDSATNPTGLCRLDNVVPMGIGFGVSIAAAAGTLSLLFLPIEHARPVLPSSTLSTSAQEN